MSESQLPADAIVMENKTGYIFRKMNHVQWRRIDVGPRDSHCLMVREIENSTFPERFTILRNRKAKADRLDLKPGVAEISLKSKTYAEINVRYVFVVRVNEDEGTALATWFDSSEELGVAEVNAFDLIQKDVSEFGWWDRFKTQTVESFIFDKRES